MLSVVVAQRRRATTKGHAAGAMERAAADCGTTGRGRAEAAADPAAAIAAAAAAAAAAVVVPFSAAALLAVLPLHVRLFDRLQVFSAVVTVKSEKKIKTVQVEFSGFLFPTVKIEQKINKSPCGLNFVGYHMLRIAFKEYRDCPLRYSRPLYTTFRNKRCSGPGRFSR